jgi:hypothetical protein
LLRSTSRAPGSIYVTWLLRSGDCRRAELGEKTLETTWPHLPLLQIEKPGQEDQTHTVHQSQCPAIYDLMTGFYFSQVAEQNSGVSSDAYQRYSLLRALRVCGGPGMRLQGGIRPVVELTVEKIAT